MNHAVNLLLMLAVFFTGSLPAQAESDNPFGFETQTHPLQYEYCKKAPGLFRDHGYKCSSAPRPHPDLQEYMLQFVEDVGLCSISANRTHMSFSIFAGEPRGGSDAEIDIDYDMLMHADPQRKLHIRTQIGSFLDQIGVERYDEDEDQLIRILESYMWRSPDYGQRFKSQDTKVLKEVFAEMREKWFVAGQSNPLLEWEGSLKKIIEEDIRSDPSNKVEMFKRQITNKYGASSTPDSVPDDHHGRRSSDIITETRNEVLVDYRRGYHWSLQEGLGGVGDVEEIDLRLLSGDSWLVRIDFRLVTFDACQEKVDEKGGRAF